MKTRKRRSDRDPRDPRDIAEVAAELEELAMREMGPGARAILEEVRSVCRELREALLEAPAGSGQAEPPGGDDPPLFARERHAE